MNGAPTPREQIDRILGMVRRSLSFWKRGLVIFLVGALIVVPFVFTRPRDYRSETVILYHETMRADLAGDEGGNEGARRVGARLRELLLSRASLEPIINDLHLYQEKIIRGELIGAVEEMRKHVTFRARDGDTFEISFVGKTPEQTQEVTRRLGECIVREADTRRADSAKTLKEFLNSESTRNQADLKKKEADLAAFVALHPEFTPRLQGIAPQLMPSSTAGGPRPAQGDPVLASLESRAARIERQLRAANGQPAPAPKAEAFQPPPDSAELVAARQDLADKMNRFTEKHPDVIAAKNRLKAAEQAQAAATQAAREAWEQRRAASDDPPPPKNAMDEAALRQELADLQHQMLVRRAQLTKSASADAGAGGVALPVANTSVELELEFTRLQREVNEVRDRQQKLDERLFRASMTASSVMNDRNVQVSVLDPAYLPVRPSSKPRTTLLAALLAACLLLSISAMAVSAILDDKIYERMDVEKLDVLPVLVVVPRPRALPPAKTHRS
jgi:uncharacterized protein involved in exopolysaccharide biosynthesis